MNSGAGDAQMKSKSAMPARLGAMLPIQLGRQASQGSLKNALQKIILKILHGTFENNI